MTKAKLKTVSTSAARISGAGTASGVKAHAANQRAEATQSRVFGTQIPDGLDVDELARKIAANMQSSQMPVAPQEPSPLMRVLDQVKHTKGESNVKVSPIEGALYDLQVALSDLDSQSQALVQVIDPILAYDSALASGDSEMIPVASQMHGRILDLTARVNAITAYITNAKDRVQL